MADEPQPEPQPEPEPKTQPVVVEVRRVQVEIEPVFEEEPGDGMLFQPGMIPDPLEQLRRELRTIRGI